MTCAGPDAAPELAERFARLRDELAAPEVALGTVADTAGRLADRRRALALALSGLLAEIRAVLPDFGTPSRRPALHPGVDGTVVLVIASTGGGHAILLHPDDNLEVLDLPDLSRNAARHAGDRITRALLALQGPATTVHARQHADADILAALDWLAATATMPVLDRLGEGVVRVFGLQAAQWPRCRCTQPGTPWCGRGRRMGRPCKRCTTQGGVRHPTSPACWSWRCQRLPGRPTAGRSR